MPSCPHGLTADDCVTCLRARVAELEEQLEKSKNNPIKKFYKDTYYHIRRILDLVTGQDLIDEIDKLVERAEKNRW